MAGLFDQPRPRGLFGTMGNPETGSVTSPAIDPLMVQQIMPGIDYLNAGAGRGRGISRSMNLPEFSQRWGNAGVRNYVTELPAHPGVGGYLAGQDRLRLDDLVVPKANRSKGVGTAFMDELTQAADAMGRPMVLNAATDYGSTSLARLKKFYKRFGFVENKGRNYDPSISDNMYRLPRPK